jgi:hypothetical protein
MTIAPALARTASFRIQSKVSVRSIVTLVLPYR